MTADTTRAASPEPRTTTGYLELHSASRHDGLCPWSRPGSYGETERCTCHLADAILAIEAEAEADIRHDFAVLANLHGDLLKQADLVKRETE